MCQTTAGAIHIDRQAFVSM